MTVMWDLRTNLDLSPGLKHCHSNVDVLITADGDLALVSGPQELNQRFFLYLATPHGERHDPRIGCYAHDYLHEKNTRNNLHRLEQDIRSDMEYQFPEIHTKGVTCLVSDTDPYETYVSLKVSSSPEMQFLYTPEELIRLTTAINNIGVT